MQTDFPAGFIIQPISSSQYHAAFELQLACHAYPWSESVFASCLDGQYFAFQLAQQGRVVGYYVGLKVLDEGTLMDIGLSAKLRGQGLGKALLTHFLNECERLGITEIWLEVRASNLAAIHLYEQAGFELIERRKGYYPLAEGREDALIMKRG